MQNILGILKSSLQHLIYFLNSKIYEKLIE